MDDRSAGESTLFLAAIPSTSGSFQSRDVVLGLSSLRSPDVIGCVSSGRRSAGDDLESAQ